MNKSSKMNEKSKKLLKIQKNEQNSKMNENSKKLLKIPKKWTKIHNFTNGTNSPKLDEN